MQPITIRGLRALLAEQPDFECIGEASSLMTGMDLVRNRAPGVLIVDKGFGLQPVVDWVTNLRGANRETRAIVWGYSMSEAEALRAVQAGAHGIVRKTASLNNLLACVRGVASGESWIEDMLRPPEDRSQSGWRSGLTQRERQVAELVEEGLKNKEIARTLGICPGTVKIHLKHIFEKTGVRGRYGLALSGLKEKGYYSPMMPA
ncbi:MAG: response regulator transcription factor [Candidatus Solibacter usitatus]|nr:response regulator transcription factor [Candidatus Solibacter usitatus]